MRFKDFLYEAKSEGDATALRPSSLGLNGKTKFSAYKTKALSKIGKAVDSPQAKYLRALVEHAADRSDLARAEAAKKAFKAAGIGENKAMLNTINNDFMEILGPFFVVDEMPEFAEGSVYFPPNDKEPLFDFEMITDETAQFSSKRAGGRTNTLKGAQVYAAAKNDPKLQKSHAKELELLRIVAQNPVRTTPNLINEFLAKEYPSYKLQPEATDDPVSIVRLEAAVVKWIVTKSGMDFLPLVRDAVPDMWYIKSHLAANGLVIVRPLRNGKNLTKAELRSKSSPGHISDKLGFNL